MMKENWALGMMYVESDNMYKDVNGLTPIRYQAFGINSENQGVKSL